MFSLNIVSQPCKRTEKIIVPQVSDGGDGLQTWRVAANMMNKPSQTADKGWISS
jgi:hypothetical protein